MSRERITKVTTRTGDAGQTKLGTGRTVPKHSPLIRVTGAIDELNSCIGVLLAEVTDKDLDHELSEIQQALFNMGAVVTMEGEFEPPNAETLETTTDRRNAALPPLTEFVLPRGGRAASLAHMCRAVCRRAEIEFWALLSALESRPDSFTASAQYLNRLSDYFFVLARSLTVTQEKQWRGPNKK